MHENERSETYKHLEDRVRLFGLTLGQMASLFVMAMVGILFGLYASPLPPGPTIMVSVLTAGSPVVLAYAVTGRELEVWGTLFAVGRWARSEKHYLPGGGPLPEAGYVVVKPTPPPLAVVRPPEDAVAMRDKLEEVWDG